MLRRGGVVRRLLISVGCALATGGAVLAASAQADFPYPTPSGGSHDWTTLHKDPGPLTNDVGSGDWRFFATPEPSNPDPTVNRAQELFGIRGGWGTDASPTA